MTTKTQTQTQAQTEYIRLDEIIPSALNPRKHFDEEAIAELAESISKIGMIQPITVRPRLPIGYEVVAGERRLRACNLNMANDPSAPEIIECKVRELDDEQALEIMIVENLQRKDISPMEEASGFLQLIKIKHMDAKEIAAKVAKSPGYVAQRLKLNDLTDDWQKFLHDHHLSIKDALTVSSLSPKSQEELFSNEVANNHWDKGEIWECSNYTFRKYQNSLTNPPFDIEDASLVPDFGACAGCKFNSAFDGLLFPELANNPVCRNSACYQSKCNASFQSRFAAAMDDPTVVIITGEYSPSKQTNVLAKQAGSGVLTYYDYEPVDVPAPPVFEDYHGDNETQEEDVADFEQAQKAYQSELQFYNTSVRQGKLKTAFVLGGDNKGRMVSIKIKSKKAAANANQKPSAAEVVTTTAADIKESIQDIKARETRAIELDDAKIWTEVAKLIGPASNAKEITGALSDLERKAVAMAIYDRLKDHRRDGFRKLFGLKEKDYSLQIPDDIDITQITQMLRFFFLDVLPEHQINGSFKERPKVAMIMKVVESYWPEQIKVIKEKQAGTAQRRAQRVKDRIVALNKELQSLNKPAAPKATAKPTAVKAKRMNGKKPIAKKKAVKEV